VARLLAAILAAIVLVVTGAETAAQVSDATSRANQQGQPATSTRVEGSASSLRLNSNTNTLTTGNSTNRRLNRNSQVVSGTNTGANNGSLEVYEEADPYQGIVLEGSVNLPELPGFVPPATNFSQPYRPDTLLDSPAFLPAEMTLTEAAKCHNSAVTWYGGARERVQSIRLFYASKRQSPPIALTIRNYVGTAMARTSDGPFIAALCTAAYTAMIKGTSVGIVDYAVRPRNTTFGIGFGVSGGATGLPSAGAHPYAIAGALGLATGWSDHRVEGEVILQLTGLRDPSSPATTRDLAPASFISPEAVLTNPAPRTAAQPVVDRESRTPKTPHAMRLLPTATR
jgi:hypothetical protein